jgi:nucleoside-diphosphate-sugar epimerase
MSKLILGCGYLGSRVAWRWREAGHAVHVVTRTRQRAAMLTAEGYQPIVGDVLRPQTLAALPAADTVLFAVGYDRGQRPGVLEVFVAGMQSVLQALPASIGKFIYISSTGVYAQSQGEWVDENSPCEPRREGGRACLAAEQVLASHPLGSRAVVLRMAGLYGPGRIPNAEQIRHGRPIAAPAQGFLNLIHVDDAAAVVLAADERAASPRLYLASDGHPIERRAYYEELARLLAGPVPEFAPAPGDAPSALRATSNKRINNARMLAELGVKLAYPSYREGLAAIVADER